MDSDNRKEYAAVIDIPACTIPRRLGVSMHGDVVTCIDFLAETEELKSPENSGAKKVVSELMSYFKNPSFRFTIQAQPAGSDFRKNVWKALKNIPTGDTRSYGDIADMLDSSARAVGGACRDNPVPIIIPCHRVIARNGFGGYSGKTDGWELEFKRWLLNHENQNGHNS